MADPFIYYLDHGKQQQGPVTQRDIGQLWMDGQIDANTLVRTDRMQEWVPITSIQDLVPGFTIDGQHEPKRKSPWGYRAFIHLLRQPAAIFGIIMLLGIVVQLYRTLDVKWIFPPNKLPTPTMEPDELLDPSDYQSSQVSPLPPLPHLPDQDQDQDRESDSAQITSVQNPSGEQPKPSSLEGQINRALLGQPLCVKPSKIIALPVTLPPGRFYMHAYNSEIFSLPTMRMQTSLGLRNTIRPTNWVP